MLNRVLDTLDGSWKMYGDLPPMPTSQAALARVNAIGPRSDDERLPRFQVVGVFEDVPGKAGQPRRKIAGRSGMKLVLAGVARLAHAKKTLQSSLKSSDQL